MTGAENSDKESNFRKGRLPMRKIWLSVSLSLSLSLVSCSISLNSQEPQQASADSVDPETFAKSVLPVGAEFLSVSLGVNYEKRIYFIQYRARSEIRLMVVDESRKELPTDTPPDRLSFIGDQLRALLEKQPFENQKVKIYISIKNEPYGKVEVIRKNYDGLISIMKPIAPDAIAKIEEAKKQAAYSVEFEMDLLPLKKVINQLPSVIGAIDLASFACVDGFPVFCVKKSDGTYEKVDPIRVDHENACPTYEAPENAVDSSFCS